MLRQCSISTVVVVNVHYHQKKRLVKNGVLTNTPLKPGNHKVRDDHGLGSMAIHLAHHCFSFKMRWM